MTWHSNKRESKDETLFAERIFLLRRRLRNNGGWRTKRQRALYRLPLSCHHQPRTCLDPVMEEVKIPFAPKLAGTGTGNCLFLRSRTGRYFQAAVRRAFLYSLGTDIERKAVWFTRPTCPPVGVNMWWWCWFCALGSSVLEVWICGLCCEVQVHRISYEVQILRIYSISSLFTLVESFIFRFSLWLRMCQFGVLRGFLSARSSDTCGMSYLKYVINFGGFSEISEFPFCCGWVVG